MSVPAAGSPVDTAGYPNCPVIPAAVLGAGSYYPNNKVPVTRRRRRCFHSFRPPIAARMQTRSSMAAPAQKTDLREELVPYRPELHRQGAVLLPLYSRFLEYDNAHASLGDGASSQLSDQLRRPWREPGCELTSTLSPTLLNEFVFSYTTDHIFLTLWESGSASQPTSICRASSITAIAVCCRPSAIVNTAGYGGGF